MAKSIAKKIESIRKTKDYDSRMARAYGILNPEGKLQVSYKQFRLMIEAVRKPSRINEDPEDIMG